LKKSLREVNQKNKEIRDSYLHPDDIGNETLHARIKELEEANKEFLTALKSIVREPSLLRGLSVDDEVKQLISKHSHK